MSYSEVSSWTERLIGSFGGCISVDSRRNLLKKYLQKQETGASIQPLPLSSGVDTMSFEEVSTLLINHIGSFAECKDEQSQRNLLKSYLRNKELKVPSSVSVDIMSDSEVSSWIDRLIGSAGGCVTADSKRNLLRKYLKKQEAGASKEPLPLSSTVDNMPFEDVSTLLISQIGCFAECKDEQSQRNLLKTYLHNKELKGQGILRDNTHLNSVYEVHHGSDFIETNQDVFRPEATFVDNMKHANVSTMLENLNIDAIDSVKEDKDRLKQRLFSGQRIQSVSQEIKDVFNTTVQRYQDLQKKLLEGCSDLIETVQDESFKTNMSKVTEMRFQHYEDVLQSIRKKLQNMTDEFEIVVAGETSSGKSTFLNVLLGERMLPSHHLHTTASLCRVRCSENRRIELMAENVIVDTITLKADSSDLREKLESITMELLKQGEDKPLKALDIYWPVSSLHENVVPVDTPGIGERNALTKQVVEYVPKSAGYIFIVDSSHAGGVRDSGIVQLIEAIAVSSSSDDDIKGLCNTIFVCNKWDCVKKQYRENVLEDTKSKISKYFRHLKDWQIVQFNADLSSTAEDCFRKMDSFLRKLAVNNENVLYKYLVYGQINGQGTRHNRISHCRHFARASELQLLEWKANPTDDLIKLLKSLETLMVRTIQTRLGDNYRWLRTFVSVVTGLVNARVTAAELSRENVQFKIKIARRELDLATKGLEQCSEVKAIIDTEEKLLLQELQKYLTRDVLRKQLDWTNRFVEITLSKVEEDGPALIQKRLIQVVLDWVTAETGPVKQASVRITDKCKKMQAEIDLRISKIHQLELGFSLLQSLDQSGSLSSNESDRLCSDESDSLSATDIMLVVGAFCAISALPTAVVLYGLGSGLDWILKQCDATTMALKRMNKMTEQAIDKLLSENRLQNYITKFITGQHRSWLTKFQVDRQCIIASTHGTIQQMEQDLHINNDTLQMFMSKLNKCSVVLQELKKDI